MPWPTVPLRIVWNLILQVVLNARSLIAYKEIFVKVLVKNARNVQVEITTGRHTLLADEPLGVGDDAGPDPYALLLSALGACKVMTTMMYARRKGWPLERVEVGLETHKIHAKDCEDCESDPDAKVDVIEVELNFEGVLTPEQVHRLEEISERCPVHRTLIGEIKIRTTVGQIALATSKSHIEQFK